MKRFLSIILALAMIVGMIPAVFATDTATEGDDALATVTYGFYPGGRSDVSDTWLERIAYTKADSFDGITDFAVVRNANLMSFPESSDSPNDQWAFVGSGIGRTETYAKSTDGYGVTISLKADETGKGYIGTYIVGEGSWIAFKIKVPETAVYEISGITAYAYGNSSANIGMYVTPVTEELAGTVAAAVDSGTYSVEPSGTRYLVYRKDFTPFADLGISDECLMGRVNIRDTSGNYFSAEKEATDKKAQLLEADKEYYLFLQSDSRAMTIGSITLTETEPVYDFSLSAFKDTASIKDSGGYPRFFNATSYDYINQSVSTGRWAYVNNFYMSNNLAEGGDSLFCTKDLEHNSLILKLEVNNGGIYKPTLGFKKHDYDGKLNIWTVPVTEDASAYTDWAQSYDLIEKAQYIGSVDLHTDSSDVSPFVGNDVYIPAGDNYLIMTITQGVTASSREDGLHYAYITSLALERKEGVVLSTEASEIKIGGTTELSAYVADAENNPLDATITYESLNPDVATVDSATGIVKTVSAGTAVMKVTAVTENGTYTDTVEINVSAVWNPVYMFHYNALADKSIISTTPSTSASIADVTNESQLNAEISTGMWTYAANINFRTAALYGSYTQMRANYSSYGENNAIVLNAKVDMPGTYTAKIMYGPSTANGLNNIYLVPKTYAKTKNWDMTTLDGVNAAKADYANAASEVVLAASVDMHKDSEDSASAVSGIVNYTGNTVNVSEKEFYIVINVTKGCAETSNGDYFSMIGSLTLNRTGSVTATSADTTLEIGEETTVSAKALDNRNNEVTADVTYENLTPAVATLSGNTVTALTTGDAIIRATATVDGVTVTDTVTINVTPKKISVATQIGDKFSVNSDIYMGDEVEVTADEIEGKVFRHWVLGTEENGIPVSESASYTFKAMTNTYLTAVYSDVAPENAKVVEFYLENGGYVGNAVANEEGKVTLPDDPTLTGYEFGNWMLDAKTIFNGETVVTDLLTKVVGTFTALKVGDASYGDPVENKADSEKLWKRDGNVVAYGTSYTYYVWEDSEIEAVDGKKPTEPIIVLDEASKGTARMIEYDAAGFDIIEAGILFGNGTEMTVDSCMYKAKSNRNADHGQFTAKPANDEYTTACGYVIYKDGEEYKVVYSH